MTVASPRAAARGFDPIPPIHDLNDDLPSALRFIWESLNQLLRGKTNNTKDITLTTASATTVITDERIGNESYIMWSPTNQLAGGEMGVYISAQSKQTVTLSHGVGGGTRTFKICIIG